MPTEMNKFKGDGDLLVLNPVLAASAEQASFSISAVTTADGSTLNGRHWTFSTDRHDYYVWYNVEGALAGPSDPAVAGAVGIPVTLTSAAAVDGASVMSATIGQLSKLSEIGASVTASALTVTVRLHGDVADAVAVGGSPFTVDIRASGIARVIIGSKFVIHTSAGLVESVIDEVSGSVFDIASASTWRVEDINKGFGGSRLFFSANLTGAAADDPVKADNIAPNFAQREILGSNIHGVS